MTGTVNSYTNHNESAVLEESVTKLQAVDENLDKVISQQQQNDKKTINFNNNTLHEDVHETPAPSYNNDQSVYFSNPLMNSNIIQHSSKMDQFEEDMASSRPSSLQESHSSRKSLNKK